MFGVGYRGFECKPETSNVQPRLQRAASEREEEICEMILQSLVLSLAAYAGVNAFVVSYIVRCAGEPEASTFFFLTDTAISQVLLRLSKMEDERA